MSPSPSPSPPPQELTEEELELLEMAERMRTPEPEEELPLPQNILPGLDNGVMNGNSTSPESAPCPRSNELVSARRFAARHKLHPYQREAVEEFVKDTIVGQQIKLFIKQCELGNKLDGLLMVAPPFSVSKPLMDNIKSYGLAVLLSPKLSAYKHAGVPVSHVISVIRRNNLHLPNNIDHDPNALLTLKMTVGDTLTQLRATIKKLIKASIPAKQSIYDLAIKVVGDSPCTVTVKLCTRLALMRNLYTDDTSFWDKVDKKLNIIRKAALKGGGAAGNQERITRALSTYLDLDRTKYGTQSEVHNIPELGDVWQQDVDEVIQGTTSRAEPRTPTPTTPLGEPITPTPTPGTISLLPEASGNPSASSSGTT